MEDEEDPVVQEIPVYLSQALTKNLHIYQFPVTPANRDWQGTTIVNASVKPKNQIVRLEMGLDTYSDKYCSSKGEQIVLNTDGRQDPRFAKDKEREKSQYFKNDIMDKIVYESSNPCTDADRYAVAILQDRELHITPVNGIVQLRPSLTYYDKQDKRRTELDKAENSDDDEEEADQAQQVTVKFARQETDVAKKAREKSFEHISKQISEEVWHQALWKHSNTDHAELERLKLFSANTAPGSALGVSGREYVRMLVPKPDDEEGVETPSPADQIRQILINAKVMTFSDLRSLVRSEEGPLSEQALLSVLSTSASCVRGLWTARSVHLYERPSLVPAEVMAAARDHLLYLLTQQPYVDRRKVSAVVRLPPNELVEILRSVAKFNCRTGWELLLPPDVAFEAKHQDLVQRHKLYFEGRQRLFNEMMSSENTPKRQRKKSQRDSVSSDTMMSPKPRCNSVSEDDESRKRPKNKTTSGQGKRTRNISSSSHET